VPSGGSGLSAYLPLFIIAGIMAWRLRNLQKARPLRLPLLWLMPLIVMAAVCFALAALPPTGPGWLALAAGLAIGGAIGAQRSRLMRLHVEGEGSEARVMVRQSPLALMLIVGVFVMRRVLLPAGMTMDEGYPSAHALLVTDAMLGFALGMVVFSRLVLWMRAREMVANHVFDA